MVLWEGSESCAILTTVTQHVTSVRSFTFPQTLPFSDWRGNVSTSFSLILEFGGMDTLILSCFISRLKCSSDFSCAYLDLLRRVT